MTKLSFKDWLFVAAVGLMFTYFQPAHADSILGDLEYTSDNEGLTTKRALVGYQDVYGDWVLNVKVGKFQISDNSGTENFNELRFGWYKQYKTYPMSTWGYIGYLDGDHNFITGNLGLGYEVNNKLYTELDISKNVFETYQAANSRTAFTSITGRAEYKLTEKWKLTGVGFLGNTTDSNNFSGYEGHVDYHALDLLLGLKFKYQHRYKGFDNAGTGYFSPRDWTRDLFGAEYGRILTNDRSLSVKGQFLTGPQDVDGESGNFTEVKLFMQWKPNTRTTLKFTHDRVFSEVNGYDYKWNYTGIKFQYNF